MIQADSHTVTGAAPESDGKRFVSRMAFASIVVSLGVMALKFLAWRVTGSVALFSDALESIVNVIAATRPSPTKARRWAISSGWTT